MRDRVKEGERLLKEKQRVGKESAMKRKREGKYLMAHVWQILTSSSLGHNPKKWAMGVCLMITRLPQLSVR